MNLLTITGERFSIVRRSRTVAYEAGTVEELGTVAGHMSSVGGSSTRGGASSDRESRAATLICETIDIDPACEVTDDQGQTWQVRWATQATGLGLDHTRAGVTLVDGRST